MVTASSTLFKTSLLQKSKSPLLNALDSLSVIQDSGESTFAAVLLREGS